jgi:hypothetical protein
MQETNKGTIEKSEPTKLFGLAECRRGSWQQSAWLMVFLVGATLINHWFKPAGASLWLRVAVVVGPLIPGVLFIRTLVRDLRRLDELQQKIYIDSIALASGGTFLFAILYPAVHKAGFIVEMTPYDFGIVMAVLTAISYLIAKVRYR